MFVCMAHVAPSPALFDLATAKAKVSKAIEDSAPSQFKHFYASQLFDRMVTSCLIYFVDNLQLTTLSQVCIFHAAVRCSLALPSPQHNRKLQSHNLCNHPK